MSVIYDKDLRKHTNEFQRVVLGASETSSEESVKVNLRKKT